MGSYLTGLENRSAITYRVKETGALLAPDTTLHDIRYKMTGENNQEVFHLEPVSYRFGNGMDHDLEHPAERAAAFEAWLREQNNAETSYRTPDEWVSRWVEGTVTFFNDHSFNPWGGPSWTQLVQNRIKSDTTTVSAAHFHVQAGISSDRIPWFRRQS